MNLQDVDLMNKEQIVECLILTHEATAKISNFFNFFGFEAEALEDKKKRLENQTLELCRDELAGVIMMSQAFKKGNVKIV